MFGGAGFWSGFLTACVLVGAIPSSSPECQKLHWDAGHREECRKTKRILAKRKAKKEAKKKKEMAKQPIEEVD